MLFRSMEQYMYTYLNQRYGLKSLIIEWANVIVSGIGKYAKGDSDIALFGKLLQNKCDEDYRLVHQEVKATIANILSSKTNKRHHNKSEENIDKLLKEMQNYEIDEVSAKNVVKKMYNEEDSNKVLAIIINTIKKLGGNNKILFNDFLKVKLIMIIVHT